MVYIILQYFSGGNGSTASYMCSSAQTNKKEILSKHPYNQWVDQKNRQWILWFFLSFFDPESAGQAFEG